LNLLNDRVHDDHKLLVSNEFFPLYFLIKNSLDQVQLYYRERDYTQEAYLIQGLRGYFQKILIFYFLFKRK